MSHNFKKQNEAIEFSKSSPDFLVFSKEISVRGTRIFFVSTVHQMWSWYAKTNLRKHYEVISSRPSKLYFDLDYKICDNTDKSGSDMTVALIKRVNIVLKEDFNIQNEYQDVLVLESSNLKKFSIHLVFTKVHFENNVLMQDFIKLLESKFTKEEKQLFQVKSKEQVSSFIDRRVYTQNRNFRMYLSEKYGKSNPLIVSKLDTSVKEFSLVEEIEFEVFKSSLITLVQDGSREVKMTSEVKLPTSNVSDHKQQSHHYSLSTSPFPDVEEFIMKRIQPGGKIRAWKFYERNSILYSISGWRYCQNVRRHHSRNNIFYICNLYTMTLVQGCHSCYDYRSDPIKIDVNNSFLMNDTF